MISDINNKDTVNPSNYTFAEVLKEVENNGDNLSKALLHHILPFVPDDLRGELGATFLPMVNFNDYDEDDKKHLLLGKATFTSMFGEGISKVQADIYWDNLTEYKEKVLMDGTVFTVASYARSFLIFDTAEDFVNASKSQFTRDFLEQSYKYLMGSMVTDARLEQMDEAQMYNILLDKHGYKALAEAIKNYTKNVHSFESAYFLRKW